jgi:hypothetical protein
MADTPRQPKYRVVGIREDGKHVPLSVYLSLESAETIATLARFGPTFTKIVIESDEDET